MSEIAEFRSQYKVGVVQSVTDLPKNLRKCEFDIGSSTIVVVTAASNVREGSRLAVAPVNSKVLGSSGEVITVTQQSVGGVMSQGIFCDSKMLGWKGGAEGIAAQIPKAVEIGDAPPATKPRPADTSKSEASNVPSVDVEPLFAKKLSKEEKKKLAEEKRKARKAAKEAAKQQEG